MEKIQHQVLLCLSQWNNQNLGRQQKGLPGARGRSGDHRHQRGDELCEEKLQYNLDRPAAGGDYGHVEVGGWNHAGG